MKHNSRTAIVLFVAVLVWPNANLLAEGPEGTLAKIARTGEFVIGYRTNASLLSYENADGQPSGFSVDLCRRIAAGIRAHLSSRQRHIHGRAATRLLARNLIDAKVIVVATRKKAWNGLTGTVSTRLLRIRSN